MIFSLWNVRGLNKPFKQKKLRSFLQINKVDIIGCLETKIQATNAKKSSKFIWPGMEGIC